MTVTVRLFQLLPSAECCQFRHNTSCYTVQINIQSAHLVLFRYTAGIFSVLLLMWQSVCSSYCCQLNAVSFSRTLHAALYRSIYSVLTWSSLGTLQGFSVCYCECGSPSVPVTAVSLMLSVSAQHFMLHCINPYTVC